MRETEKIQIYGYILRHRNALDDELRQRQANLRYKEIGIVDCIELACLIERRDSFYRFSSDLLTLLKLAETHELGGNPSGVPPSTI